MEDTLKPARSLRIAIASLGRFHVLDLARELTALGHEVQFISYVSSHRAEKFGLQKRSRSSFLPLVFPVLILQRFLGNRGQLLVERLLYPIANFAVRLMTRKCDVFICMSGVYLEAARRARDVYGAKIIVERGSRHILSQREILRAIPGARPPSSYTVSRELAGYDLADKISVPSGHVVDSFRAYAIGADRLWVNPYGVDVSRFTVCQDRNEAPEFDLIFVGGWSLRKGVDLLERMIKSSGDLTLLHVGGAGDVPFPSHPRMTSLGLVDQLSLPTMYARAKALILPSREEGLSLVQIQALASGLPVVCTDRTGGADLRAWIDFPEAVVVVPPDDVDALVVGARSGTSVSDRLRGTDLLGERGRKNLAWSAYGMRYHQALLQLCEAA